MTSGEVQHQFREEEVPNAAYGRVSEYSYTNVPAGDPANVTLTVTRANGTSYTVHLEMRQEGGAWKITAFDRI